MIVDGWVGPARSSEPFGIEGPSGLQSEHRQRAERLGGHLHQRVEQQRTYSKGAGTVLAFVVAAMAAFTASCASRAEAQDVMPPPISRAKAQYFKDNPAAWNDFISQLPRRSAAPTPTANRFVPPPGTGGTWTAVTAAPGGGLGNPLLLHDGTVIVHVSESQTWYKLTPDGNGNYATGGWTTIAALPANYGPLYFASAVLPDGKVIMQGGEYNLDCTSSQENAVWVNLGAIYDPVADSWTAVNPPSGYNTAKCSGSQPAIGDSESIILPTSEVFMLGPCCAAGGADFLFNETNLTYTATNGFPGWQDEQGYTLLPTGNVLTIDVPDPDATHIYNPSTGNWTPGASTPVSLVDPCGNNEMGPAVTRPDGTTVAFGGYAETTPNCTASADPTAIYTASTNNWAPGPSVPQVSGTYYSLADAPAAMLNTGNILFAASSGYDTIPTHFFEYPSNNSTPFQVADPIYNASGSAAFEYNLLDLPNGQILMTDGSQIAEVYTPSGSYSASWAPTVTKVPSCISPNHSYPLSGTQLAGLSQGAAYGDDVQGATNYPLVRIVNNASGQVYYARTNNPSTLSIAPTTASSVSFRVASATQTGASALFVVANGIPSRFPTGTPVTVSASCAEPVNSHDFNGDGTSDILWRNTSSNELAIWLMSNGQVSSGADVAQVASVWSVVGTRDFNNDGSADILWLDTSGDLAVWLMDGTAVSSYNSLGNVGTQWSVAGTGDFNNDGTGDILWRNTSTGDVALWLMLDGQFGLGLDLGVVQPVWQVVGTGDFNGDGTTDILWHNTQTGDYAIWLMSNGKMSSGADLGVVGGTWSVVGTGDFNGDGTSDILWRDGSGDLAIWLMSNGQFSSGATIAQVSTAWSVAETGDFNRDGKSDILWLCTTGGSACSAGDLAVWLMNGTSLGSGIGLGNVGSSWQVQGQNAD